MLRIWPVLGLIFVSYFVIALRLFYWTILSGDRLRLAGASQYFLELTIPAERGSIIASDEYPLVINQPAYLVYAEPRNISDRNIFIKSVAEILELDMLKLKDLLADKERVWIPLGYKIEEQKIQELKKLGLKGLGFEKEPKRFYPEASMSAHLLGFVGSTEQGMPKGYFGLEGYYNRELQGKNGVLQLEKDAKGSPILVGEAKRLDPENGRTLVLWLDRTIQYIVEKRLAEGMRRYGAKEGSIVVMDPKSGGILALAAYPQYDPANFQKFDKSLYKNPVVSQSYEPGSTFKVLVMSAGLEEKVITPVTIIDESGPVKVGEYLIRTWNDEYHGLTTMIKVLEHSSNVGMVYLSRKLGREKLVKYIHEFGFDNMTGVDLEDEATPDIRADEEWKEIDLATASFGQGIAVTPLQMVRAVAALANKGWLMEPHVLKEIRDEKGKAIEIKPKKVRQVINEATAGVITEMMVAAVDNGEAKWAKPKGYRIAGKTGTAQIPVAGHYDEKKTIASFVGFAPSDNPRFVMLVTLREPASSPWGSETAAPLFFTIARDLFTYLGIPPSM